MILSWTGPLVDRLGLNHLRSDLVLMDPLWWRPMAVASARSRPCWSFMVLLFVLDFPLGLRKVALLSNGNGARLALPLLPCLASTPKDLVEAGLLTFD